MASVFAVAALLAAGCSAKHTPPDAQTVPGGSATVPQSVASTVEPPIPTPTPTPPAPLARLALSPHSGAKTVSPVAPITVSVTDGVLGTVRLVNTGTGKVVKGKLSDDKTSWQASEVLGYSNAYKLSATATNADGIKASKTSTFQTLTPDNLTMPYLNVPGGFSMTNGATYGVGVIPVVHFDEPITNKAAAEKALTVTTKPEVAGAWYWVDDSNVHYRPKDYWPTGTKVTVSANVYGVQVGPGLYGQADASVSFKIGPKHIAIADDTTHQVKVYFNGKLQRTMPTSMGRHTTIPGVNGPVSLWTMQGTYTVISHENPAIMDSSTFGVPVNSPNGYRVSIYWATKISTDGIYLHYLNTEYAQGSYDVSHGCLNLNLDNATWYFNTSLIGDVVKVVSPDAPKIELWQGGDWDVPWAKWLKGSALHN
ncbi:MAG: Ig-like domain-containing protein [Actinomycetia bacterium]|nr:Ig-like domain-containing protein [Actinomycetes bacterium]